jgi:exosortase
VAALTWSFWPTIQELIAFWSTNEDYSVGALVPLIVAYFVWQRRDALRQAVGEPALAGLGLLAASQVLRAVGIYYAYSSVERLSLVASLAGLVWMAFGATLARRTAWLFVFLLLMAPPPQSLHEAVSVPLQEFAAISAVFSLELLGVWVQRVGNVLEIDGRTQVAVAEACSGLRMLSAFVVVAATMALLARRPAWQRIVLVASSIPVAVACNSIRLAATVLLYHWISSQVAERFFHDFAGLVMMPLAVLILLGELALPQPN